MSPRIPTPMPPTPPLGTSYPPVPAARGELTTLQEAAVLRSIGRELERSQEVDGDAAPASRDTTDQARARIERRIARLEGAFGTFMQSHARSLELQSAQGVEQKKNTRISKKGSKSATVAAYLGAAGPLILFFTKVLGDYADAHPGAPLTITGLVLAIVRTATWYQAKASHVATGADPPEGA